MAVLCLVAPVLSDIDPRDCSPSGSFVHGGSLTPVLECLATPSFRVSSQPWRDRTGVSHIASRFFTSWATMEALVHGHILLKFSLGTYMCPIHDRSVLAKIITVLRIFHLEIRVDAEKVSLDSFTWSCLYCLLSESLNHFFFPTHLIHSLDFPLAWSFPLRVLYCLSVKVFWCPEVSKFTMTSAITRNSKEESSWFFVGSHLSARCLNVRVMLLEEIFWPTALTKGIWQWLSGGDGVKGMGAKA